MAFQGDPTRGLRSLRTRIQNDADTIAALEEIERLKGLDNVRADLQREADEIEAKVTSGRQTLADLVAAIADKTAALARIQGEQQTLAADARHQAESIVAQARQEAERILADTNGKADAALDTAAAAAAKITATADDTRKQIETEHVARRAEIAAAQKKLDAILASTEAARRKHKAFLDTLEKA